MLHGPASPSRGAPSVRAYNQYIAMLFPRLSKVCSSPYKGISLLFLITALILNDVNDLGYEVLRNACINCRGLEAVTAVKINTVVFYSRYVVTNYTVVILTVKVTP